MKGEKHMPSEEYLKRKRAYINRHRREFYKTMSFDLRLDTEKDMIDYLDSQPSRQACIKKAIKAQMELEKVEK